MRSRPLALLATGALSVLVAVTAAAPPPSPVTRSSSGAATRCPRSPPSTGRPSRSSYDSTTSPTRIGIYVGQRIRIAAPAAHPPAAAPPAPAPRSHVVAAGEHLTGIARRYGTTVAAIAKSNT